MDIYARVGKEVARLRARRGVTQEQLAEAVRISPSYVARIEAGSKRPALDVLERIAQSLGAPVGELFAAGPLRAMPETTIPPALGRIAAALPTREKRLLVEVAKRFERGALASRGRVRPR